MLSKEEEEMKQQNMVVGVVVVGGGEWVGVVGGKVGRGSGGLLHIQIISRQISDLYIAGFPVISLTLVYPDVI